MPPPPCAAQIIVADPDDDESTLRAKIHSASGGRAALVVPDESDKFDTPLAVRVLARSAYRDGVHLAIVSRRRKVHYWASIEGITCYSRTTDLPSERGRAAATAIALIGDAVS